MSSSLLIVLIGSSQYDNRLLVVTAQPGRESRLQRFRKLFLKNKNWVGFSAGALIFLVAKSRTIWNILFNEVTSNYKIFKSPCFTRIMKRKNDSCQFYYQWNLFLLWFSVSMILLAVPFPNLDIETKCSASGLVHLLFWKKSIHIRASALNLDIHCFLLLTKDLTFSTNLQ